MAAHAVVSRELWAYFCFPENWKFMKLVFDSSNYACLWQKNVVKDNSKYQIEMLFIMVL